MRESATTSAKPLVDADRQASASFFGRDGARRFFPIILLVALAVAFLLTSSRFLQFNNLLIVAQQAVVLLVAALGMTFVVIAGSIDLSVGAIVAIAALLAAKTSGSIGVLAILPACAVGVVCGLINGLIVAKGKVPSFIVTLGAMVVYRGVVLYFTRGGRSLSRTKRFSTLIPAARLESRIPC
jgi:ribose transport system permease protein